MPHFFINSKSINEGIAIVSDKETFNHIAKALRAKVGENLLLIDENQIQYETKIQEISNKEILCEIQKSYKSRRKLEFELYLAQTPLNSDSQATVIGKATELGVYGVYPIYTDNCAVKKDIINKKIEKWQKIMFESSKQCERADIPTCFPLTSLEKLPKFDRVIAFCERLTELPLKKYLSENPIKKGEKILAIIGPEGGFSQREFDYFKEKNFAMVSLGDLILKADTAVTVALGNIVYEY